MKRDMQLIFIKNERDIIAPLDEECEMRQIDVPKNFHPNDPTDKCQNSRKILHLEHKVQIGLKIAAFPLDLVTIKLEVKLKPTTSGLRS